MKQHLIFAAKVLAVVIAGEVTGVTAKVRGMVGNAIPKKSV